MPINAGKRSITVRQNPCGGGEKTLTLSGVPELGGEHFCTITLGASAPYVTWGWRYAKDGPDGAYTNVGGGTFTASFSSANEIYELMPTLLYLPPEGMDKLTPMPYTVGAPYAPSWAQLEGEIEITIERGTAGLPNLRLVDMVDDPCADAGVDISCETFKRVGVYLECTDDCSNAITSLSIEGEVRTRTVDAFGNTTCTVTPGPPFTLARYNNDTPGSKFFLCASTVSHGNKLTSTDNPFFFVALPNTTYVVTKVHVGTVSGSNSFDVQYERGVMQVASIGVLPEGSGNCLRNPLLDNEPDWSSIPSWSSAVTSFAGAGASIIFAPDLPYEDTYVEDTTSWPDPEELFVTTIIPNGYVGPKFFYAKIDLVLTTQGSAAVGNCVASGGCTYYIRKDCASQEVHISRGPYANTINVGATTFAEAQAANVENPYPGVTSQTESIHEVPGMGSGGIRIQRSTFAWLGTNGPSINISLGSLDNITLAGME